jgi:hypothetical protein
MSHHQNQNNEDLVLSTEDFIVCLDSKNASNYYNGSMNSNVSFRFEDSIRKTYGSIDMYFSVLNFTCPVSFYQLNKNNNFLSMYINYVLVNIYFDEGNYDVNSFVDAFNIKLSVYNIQIAYNTLTNKFTLTSSYYFSINNNSTIYNVMGFHRNTNINCSFSVTTENYILNCSHCCNFGGINNINIKCSNLCTKNVDSYNKSTSTIIQAIPVITGALGTLFFEKRVDYNFKLNNDVLDNINILLMDDEENFIDMNGNYWNLTLLFRTRNTCRLHNPTFLDIMIGNPTNPP